MANIPANTEFHEITKTWRWRDRHGVFHDPREMETRHLFHVFRMIWDHTMPKEAQSSIFPNRYVFPAFYTSRYVANAVIICGNELFKRSDLEPYMRVELTRMWNYLHRNQKKLMPALQQITRYALPLEIPQ